MLAFVALLFSSPAQAANCYAATSQGSTGPADYASYCWIDALIPIFNKGHVAIVMDGDKFLGLITRYDLLTYLRRRAQ